MAHSLLLDLPSIKPVSAPQRLLPNSGQIRGDGRDGASLFPESFELRVMSVPFCPTQKHFLRQQPFPPQSQQALPIQIARV
jgi:hypothetical protein